VIETVPALLFHWTSAVRAETIREQGLLPGDAHSTGGFLGFHRDEPAVCLVKEGDLDEPFNPAVVLDDDPLRVEVLQASLAPDLLAPDLNALLDPDIVFRARDEGVDLLDSSRWTAEESLLRSGTARYLVSIGPHQIRSSRVPPRSMRWNPSYLYAWGDDGAIREQIMDRLFNFFKRYRRPDRHPDELRVAYFG